MTQELLKPEGHVGLSSPGPEKNPDSKVRNATLQDASFLSPYPASHSWIYGDADDTDLESNAGSCFSEPQRSEFAQPSIGVLPTGVMRSIADQISLLFRHDDVLGTSLLEAFYSMNVKMFEHLIYDYLMTYCVELETEASDVVELEAVQFFRRRLREIMNSISKRFTPEGKLKADSDDPKISSGLWCK
jgi:hypothetical protein